jgi:hypothetical protein
VGLWSDNPRRLPPDVSDPKRLAWLFDPEPGADGLCRPEDLPAVWRKQLVDELRYDLQVLGPFADAAVDRVELSIGRRVTLAALLGAYKPDLSLLRLAKAYADHELTSEYRALPKPIAVVINHLMIALARLRLDERISSLPDTKLRESWGKLAALSWLDEQTRSVLRLATGCLVG